MRSRILRFLRILITAALFSCTINVNADSGNHQSNHDMEYVMYGMVLTMTIWMIYRISTGSAHSVSANEFQRNCQQVSTKTEPAQQKQKVELMILNYRF